MKEPTILQYIYINFNLCEISNNMNGRKTLIYSVDVQQKKVSQINYLGNAKFTQFRKIYIRALLKAAIL